MDARLLPFSSAKFPWAGGRGGGVAPKYRVCADTWGRGRNRTSRSHEAPRSRAPAGGRTGAACQRTTGGSILRDRRFVRQGLERIFILLLVVSVVCNSYLVRSNYSVDDGMRRTHAYYSQDLFTYLSGLWQQNPSVGCPGCMVHVAWYLLHSICCIASIVYVACPEPIPWPHTYESCRDRCLRRSPEAARTPYFARSITYIHMRMHILRGTRKDGRTDRHADGWHERPGHAKSTAAHSGLLVTLPLIRYCHAMRHAMRPRGQANKLYIELHAGDK